MAPLTRIVAVKVLNCVGSGTFGDIISGILYAAELPDVDVINMSLGAGFPKRAVGGGLLVAAMNRAVNYAVARGKLVVSAAGNEAVNMDRDRDTAWVPAQSGAGIAVYATGWDDTLAGYSNFGRSSTWVGAPGGDFDNPPPPISGCFLAPPLQGLVMGACSRFSIFFDCGDGISFLAGDGTSVAAPLVSGVAALIDGETEGILNGGQLRIILSNSADDLGAPGVDAFFSHGRVNARQAVE